MAISVAAPLIGLSFTAGDLFTYSIAAAFAGLVANAQAAIEIDHGLNGNLNGSLDYYGVMLEYT
jgi:hypothetical protein